MRRRQVALPSLVHDFCHARLDTVSIGPRRELRLTVAPLVWQGPRGRCAEAVSVRFGGIANFADVSTFFRDSPHEWSELAWLRYAESRRSKPGSLFFELAFERIDARLLIRCSSLQVGSPEAAGS